jgi:hypothetical protein
VSAVRTSIVTGRRRRRATSLWFGAAAPSGHEANWIETVPGTSWFAILRLYGPLEAWFDQTGRPGEFERVDGGR